MAKTSLKDALQRKTAERGESSAHPNAAEALAAAVGQSGVGEPDTKRLNVNVPADLYDRFKEKADRKGHTLTWLVKQYLEDYVSRE